MIKLLVLLIVINYCSAVPKSFFYPYGYDFKDQRLELGDDVESELVILETPIAFYSRRYRDIYINNNGFLSFDSPLSDYSDDLSLPVGKHKVIAPFLSDVDTSLTGNVFFRESSDPTLLTQARRDIINRFPDHASFDPYSVLVATWVDVGYYSQRYDKVNSFQVVIASDDYNSFAFFYYADDGIQWLNADPKPSLSPIASAGFDAGDNYNWFGLPGSGTDDIKLLSTSSNVEILGMWLFKIGLTDHSSTNIQQPPNYEESKDRREDNDEPSSCSSGGSDMCHNQAQCIDKDEGFCCQCQSPLIGNGLACIEKASPQRMFGLVKGAVNGIRIPSQDLIAYFITREGRAYTAISKIPPEIGHPLQSVYIIASIVGWMFSMPSSPSAKNGFMITGGVFNRSATLRYSPGGETLQIEQVFSGLGNDGLFKVETTLQGNVPEIDDNSKVSVDDYKEEYILNDAGVYSSYKDYYYRVDNIAKRVTIDQTIRWKSTPCQEEIEKINMKINRVNLAYVVKDKAVRIGATVQLSGRKESDPCDLARCDSNAHCNPLDRIFECVCNDGYEGDGYVCTDLRDPCSAARCGENAYCEPQDRYFECVCLDGYEGDGYVCTDSNDPCSTAICGENAYCSPQGQYFECICKDGYDGDGYVCTGSTESICRDNNDCDYNAECLYSDIIGQYACQCQDGFEGDGKRCTPDESHKRTCRSDRDCDYNARCQYDAGDYVCQCKSGYKGDGYKCTVEVQDGCGGVSCGENAECVEDPFLNHALCQCKEGFQGDGQTCIQIEFSCNEVDNCDTNAECLFDPMIDEYKCECADGFSGDGFSCSDGRPKVTCDKCDVNARCIFDLAGMFFHCQCTDGYSGDGRICTPTGETCDVARNCDRDADCLWDKRTTTYMCKCSKGYVGNGYLCEKKSNNEDADCNLADNCHKNAHCIYDQEIDDFKCKCDVGFEGDGYQCEGTVDCRYNDVCDDNAICSYDRLTRQYHCSCNEGFEGDGRKCKKPGDCSEDKSVCDINAHCEKRRGEFLCVCDEGYSGDGKRCGSTGKGGSYLIYAQGMSITRLPFEPTGEDKGETINVKEGQTAVGVAVDCFSRYLYWSDVKGKVINRARFDGSKNETVFTGLGSPEGLAIDWIARNIYWTDSITDTIEVSSLDGKYHKILIDTDLRNPRSIVVDPFEGMIFWTDWYRPAPKIESAKMDGSERKTLVNSDIELPNGLTIDYEEKQICWADAGNKYVECISYDGFGRRVIYKSTSKPFGITYANDMFYWTDWSQKSIANIGKFGGQINTPIELPEVGNGRLYGIAAVPEECPSGSNACLLNNGGCRFLCLPTPNGGRSCECPDNIEQRECNRIGLFV